MKWLTRQSLKIKERFLLNVFDITLSGSLIALLIILQIFFRSFNRILGIRIEVIYIFSIVFGALFGAWRGAVISLFADTISLLIRGNIHRWLWEFAIIPVLISWIVGLILKNLGNKKKENRLTISISLVSTILVLVYIVFTLLKLKQESLSVIIFKNWEIEYILLPIIPLSLITYIWIVIFFCFSREKLLKKANLSVNNLNKNNKIENLRLLSLVSAIILFCYTLFRWFWEPYGVLVFLNRFFSNRSISFEAYLKLQTMGFVSTLFSIPIATLIIPKLFKVVLIYKEKNELRRTLVKLAQKK